QLQDDYLDTFGDPVVFGKEIGGDILNDKKTWLLIKALGSEYGDELRKYIGVTNADADEKIACVTRIYRNAGLPEKCHDLIEHYAQEAMKTLAMIDIDAESYDFFSKLVAKSSTRTH
ncbi:MAG: polyprenyl synthetase family protein, partial [Muribaculaceae bacterium]|nr:polyprenyl synthetase family protein [Muribaculaceae bacterium]